MAEYTKIGRIRPDYVDEWDASRGYTALEMVKSADSYHAYIAKQDVPAGTPLTNAEYWGEVLDVSDVIAESVAATNRANTAAANADAAREDIQDDLNGMRDELHAKGDAIVCTAEGETITLTDSSDDPMRGLRIFGKTTQDGTPVSADAPVPLINKGKKGNVEVKAAKKRYPWRYIVESIKNGTAVSKFPVGTQLVINHSKYGTRLFDVVAHNYLKSVHDENAHTMTIQQHDLLPGTQFDAPEAFYYAETQLAAGTYNVILATAYGGWAAGTYQFTLTQAVPAGGQLRINGYESTAITSLEVQSFANRTTNTAAESVAITVGSGGTNLGTFGEGAINSIQRVSYGSNNYKESAMRQLLNSSAAAGSVWTPQTKFDRPPSWQTSLAGYKAGLDQNFLAVVGKVILPCSANNTYEAPDSSITKGAKYTLNDEFYLASRAEIFGSHDVNDGTVLFPFYEGAGNADRIKYRDGSAAIWWLRTPNSGSANAVRLVYSDGTVSSYGADRALGLAPACTIIGVDGDFDGDVQIVERGETYADGQPQTLVVITPNGLPGIPDPSDSTYTDENGQMWVCDEVNLQRRVYVQRCGVKVYDGSPDEGWTVNADTKVAQDGYFGYHKANARCLCSHYPWGYVGDRIYIGASLNIYDQSITTESEWRTKLAASPMTVLYQLATPIETPLTAEEIAAYRALHTNKPNTTIYNDEGAHMEVSYNADTKTYIDNKISELAAAIVNTNA